MSVVISSGDRQWSRVEACNAQLAHLVVERRPGQAMATRQVYLVTP